MVRIRALAQMGTEAMSMHFLPEKAVERKAI